MPTISLETISLSEHHLFTNSIECSGITTNGFSPSLSTSILLNILKFASISCSLYSVNLTVFRKPLPLVLLPILFLAPDRNNIRAERKDGPTEFIIPTLKLNLLSFFINNILPKIPLYPFSFIDKIYISFQPFRSSHGILFSHNTTILASGYVFLSARSEGLKHTISPIPPHAITRTDLILSTLFDYKIKGNHKTQRVYNICLEILLSSLQFCRYSSEERI